MKRLLVLLTLFTVLLTGCTKKERVPADIVENGDVVNIDFAGYFNGVQFEGGTAEGYDLRIGSNSFVDDFEYQLIGMKVGESKTITVTFPFFYPSSPQLAGQDVQFEVTINEINR